METHPCWWDRHLPPEKRYEAKACCAVAFFLWLMRMIALALLWLA